jgi:secreted PhoX family phosphatase
VRGRPGRPTLTKLTALGRFRHENVALRAEPGKRLAAYMGDDRRGGHLWKFVSDGAVTDPADPATGKLLERGTLYAARLDADYTGRWVPVAPGTPVAKPNPEDTVDEVVWLPARPAGGHVLVGTAGAAAADVSVREWQAAAERFAGKPLERMTLGDLVAGPDPLAVILTDAFAMANAAGATPCARPEDVEVHPAGRVGVRRVHGHDRGRGRVAGPGGLPRLGPAEQPAVRGDLPAAGGRGRPGGRHVHVGRFVSAGELADLGGGFACADNLAFDPAHHLWMVCDVTTPAHNFPVTRTPADGSRPGEKNFLGVFGNNAMFLIPTAGPLAGVPHCFAIGPMEAELTGPTFAPDGRSLLLSVQHPGELYGTRGKAQAGRARTPRRARPAVRAKRPRTATPTSGRS